MNLYILWHINQWTQSGLQCTKRNELRSVPITDKQCALSDAFKTIKIKRIKNKDTGK